MISTKGSPWGMGIISIHFRGCYLHSIFWESTREFEPEELACYWNCNLFGVGLIPYDTQILYSPFWCEWLSVFPDSDSLLHIFMWMTFGLPWVPRRFGGWRPIKGSLDIYYGWVLPKRGEGLEFMPIVKSGECDFLVGLGGYFDDLYFPLCRMYNIGESVSLSACLPIISGERVIPETSMVFVGVSSFPSP